MSNLDSTQRILILRKIGCVAIICVFFGIAFTALWNGFIRNNLTPQLSEMTSRDIMISSEFNNITTSSAIGSDETIRISLRKPYETYPFLVHIKTATDNWKIVRTFSVEPALIDMSTFSAQHSIDIQVDVIAPESVGESAGETKQIYMGNFLLKHNTSPANFSNMFSTTSNSIMHSVALFVFLMLGLICVLPAQRHVPFMVLLLLAPFVSLVLLTSLMQLLYIAGFLRPVVFFICLGVIFIVALTFILLKKKPLSRKQVTGIGVYFGISLLLSIILPLHNFVTVSYDSFTYFLYGKYIYEIGALSLSAIGWIASLGCTLPLIYTFGNFFGTDFLHGIHFLMLFTFVCFIVWICVTEITGNWIRKLLCSIGVILSLSSCYFFVFLGMAALTNSISSYLLVLFTICLYKLEVTKQPCWYYLAFIFNLAFAFTRTETLVFSGVFLYLLATQYSNQLHNAILVTLHSSMVILWLQRIFWLQPSLQSDFITTERIFLICAFYVAFTIYSFLSVKIIKLQVLQKRYLLLIGCSLVLITSFLIFGKAFIANGITLFINMLQLDGYWGITWLAVLLLYLIMWGKTGYAGRRSIISVVFVYFSMLFSIFCFREAPLRLGWGDSANRMLIPIIPLLFMDLAIRAFKPTTSTSSGLMPNVMPFQDP